MRHRKGCSNYPLRLIRGAKQQSLDVCYPLWILSTQQQHKLLVHRKNHRDYKSFSLFLIWVSTTATTVKNSEKKNLPAFVTEWLTILWACLFQALGFCFLCFKCFMMMSLGLKTFPVVYLSKKNLVLMVVSPISRSSFVCCLGCWNQYPVGSLSRVRDLPKKHHLLWLFCCFREHHFRKKREWLFVVCQASSSISYYLMFSLTLIALKFFWA